MAAQRKFDNKPKSCLNYDYFEFLIDGLRRGSYSTVYYHFFFCMRRVAVITSALWLNQYPALQLILFYIGSAFAMVFIAAASPFETTFENRLEIFNELIVLLITFIQLGIFMDDWSAE